jgi:predicted RNA-binding Zn ribbon-like protein
VAAAREWTFELTGGALCLDFANTLGDRPRGRDEHLAGFPGLISFARQAGLLRPATARRLLRHAAGQPRRTRRAFQRALALRECLYRVFAALARGRSPDPSDVSVLNDALARALSRLQLRPRGAGFAWAWPDDADDLERVLWPVARSAGELLVSAPRPPVRECASATCSWLFLDHSRGGRRRWCDMKTCGNRHKARQHYRRRRAGRPAPAPQ